MARMLLPLHVKVLVSAPTEHRDALVGIVTDDTEPTKLS